MFIFYTSGNTGVIISVYHDIHLYSGIGVRGKVYVLSRVTGFKGPSCAVGSVPNIGNP